MLRLRLRLRLRLLLLRLTRLCLLPVTLCRLSWILTWLTTHGWMRSFSCWTRRMSGILCWLASGILVSGTRVTRVTGIVTWITRIVAGIIRVVARIARVMSRIAWVVIGIAWVVAGIAWIVAGISRIMCLMTGVVTGIVAGITRIVMPGILGLVPRIVGQMTRILVMLRRSGRRSRRTRCSNTLRRRCSRNRGLPRGSRQRGRIPWLDGLLHDGTHHLAQPTSQPADFYLRLEGHYFFFLPRRWAPIYLLLLCQIFSFLIKLNAKFTITYPLRGGRAL